MFRVNMHKHLREIAHFILLYTLGHKKGANLFLSVTLSKINGF